MTAILVRLISERCRPLTPVPKKTEIFKTRALCQCISDLESNAFLTSQSQAFLQQHCWDGGECASLGDPSPTTHHGRVPGPLRGWPQAASGIFRAGARKPPQWESESLLQRLGISCEGPRFAQAFKCVSVLLPRAEKGQEL